MMIGECIDATGIDITTRITINNNIISVITRNIDIRTVVEVCMFLLLVLADGEWRVGDAI